MLTTLKDSHPIARKEHQCELCGCKINKGQKYYRQTNIYDGCIYEWIEHEECHQISAELDMYGVCDIDDGLSSDDFVTVLDDYIYREHYNDITDDIAEDWQCLTRYEEVCKILEELKEKGGEI
ncbi:MAG: hypothetical protein SO082_08340 [Candidatus Limisoma sp.]|nr:hypothetical protein [Candidatus Limisoma sp.]